MTDSHIQAPLQGTQDMSETAPEPLQDPVQGRLKPGTDVGSVTALTHANLLRGGAASRGGAPQDAPAPHRSKGGAILRDVMAGAPFDAAVTGFVLACLPDAEAPVMWVSDRMSRRENGRLYGAALRGFGFKGHVLRVEVSHPRDVLWAMEEGAACGGLAAVVGEIHGAPEVLSFTATKRLALRAEAADVPVWLIRSGDAGGLSAARERWRVSSVASGVHPWNAQAPGPVRWEAELFRARGRAPGVWVAEHDADAGADRLRLVPRSGDGPLAPDHHATAHAAG